MCHYLSWSEFIRCCIVRKDRWLLDPLLIRNQAGKQQEQVRCKLQIGVSCMLGVGCCL